MNNNNKHDNHDLFVVIGSIVAMTFAMPVLDAFSNIIVSGFNKIINSWNLDMQLEQACAEVQACEIGSPDSKTHAIGFTIPSEEDYDFDYDEDDE